MKKTLCQWENGPGSVLSWAIFTFFILVMAGFPTVSLAGEYSADGLRITTTTEGRIESLKMGSSLDTITFSDDGMGNSHTGGFYVRDYTVSATTGLPTGITNLIPADASTFEPDSIGSAGQYWKPFVYGISSVADDHDLSSQGINNHVARLHVHEEVNPGDGDGWYAGIYRDINIHAIDPAPTTTHDLYCLSFEVKTECGWRSMEHPNGFNENGGAEKFGRHRVSAWVEWSTGQLDKPEDYPGHPESFRNPIGNDPPGGIGSPKGFWDRFDAYDVSENMDENGLTRFSGRTYRPRTATWARIVVIADGYMPDDGLEGEVTNYVYIDNVCFFKAPDMVQAAATDLFESGAVPLAELGTGNPLGLQMDVGITPSGDYLHVTGSLINAESAPRAIDLGFALPILHEAGEQDLTWNYDARNKIGLEDVGDLDKRVPFTFAGPINKRPLFSSMGKMPTSRFNHDHSLHVSVYPISSLDIEQAGSDPYGLTFGDALNENEYDYRSVTPNISHFGYWIVDPVTDLDPHYYGHYFVEFNIGLLGGAGQETDFDFIIFRSDNPEFAESSSFREGLEKYQRSIYPNNFSRPTDTDPSEADWLFGGGFYGADPNETIPLEPQGFDKNPNDYGLRYAQSIAANSAGVPLSRLLTFCEEKNVAVQLYNRPWAAAFTNDGSAAQEQNTYATLYDIAHTTSGIGAIYPEQLAKRILLPPLASPPDPHGGPAVGQDLFSKSAYAIPVIVADSLDVVYAGDLVDAIGDEIEDTYDFYALDGECFSGLTLDNTFADVGKGNFLDLGYGANDLTAFSGQRGRLTYSFSHFQPAIPQLCGNVWLLPHLQQMLQGRDETGDGGDNSPTGNVEEEILSVNANENTFGGSKYGIIFADVIGFESNPETFSNNGDHAFNFRRSLARDKSVARLFDRLLCLSDVLEVAFDAGGHAVQGQVCWPHWNDLFTQLANECSWLSLAWGFHPSLGGMFDLDVIGHLGGDNAFDEMVEDCFHERFIPNGSYPGVEADVGFTEVFRQLHLAGWQPITNVVNTATVGGGAGGDPSTLLIERFGPYEGLGSGDRPVYVTVLNNETLTLTLTDVNNKDDVCDPAGPMMTDFVTEDEVELSGICENKYGELSQYSQSKKECFGGGFAANRNRNFWLDISDIDELGLDNFNLKGMQLIGHDADSEVVNSWDIIPASFSQHGLGYTVQRRFVLGQDPFVRIGGSAQSSYQMPGVIPDKALMVFKVWVDNKVDNGKDSGEGRAAEEYPYYRAYGDWTRTGGQEGAWEGSADVALSTDPEASALFLMDICQDGRYDIRVSWPEMPNGTSAAKYEVYQVEGDWTGAGETEAVESTLLMTSIVDQSNRARGAADEEGFVSIGEVDVNVGRGAGQVTLVVRVSSGGAEYRAGEPTILVADAVKFEKIGG